MTRYGFILLALVVTGWSVAGFSPKSFGVTLENGLPVVQWEAESEEDLHHYEVEIRMQFSPEPRIVEVQPHGAGKPYTYRDDGLFKSGEAVRYTLVAILDTGERIEVGSMEIDYTPTAVRRTWGSIKAMFQ
ncbi:MAG: hypothetical protein WD021_10155 [Rhodothermales bacterium]